jgi:hypothetical protein
MRSNKLTPISQMCWDVILEAEMNRAVDGDEWDNAVTHAEALALECIRLIEQDAGRWIKCGLEVPPLEEWVLVLGKTGQVSIAHLTHSDKTGTDWWEYDDMNTLEPSNGITHWRPLPATPTPPTEES